LGRRAGSTRERAFIPWRLGDFNGDGKLDLVVANSGGGVGAGNVSVLLGNGDGTFQAAANYDAGTTPLSVAVGDFNRDGKLDLVVASRGSFANNYTDGSVSVLLGNGDGTFQAPGAYGPVVTPNSVAVGDFNGDGNPDLAVATVGWYVDVTAGGVSALLGNGDGTFQSAVRYDSEGYDWRVVVGDFNGDGNSDLAVANGPSGAVRVLLGNGDGTFQTAVTYGMGTNADPHCAAVGDFNGDGKPDLAVANFSSANVAVLLNTCATAGPSLAISLTNATLTLSWLFPSTGFVLESATTLTNGGDWQHFPTPPTETNGQKVVNITPTGPRGFFRLRGP
jgi:hypothetical protein